MTILNAIVYISLFLGIFLTFRLLFIQFRVFPKALKGLKHSTNRTSLSTGIAGLLTISSIIGIATAISYGGPGSLIWMSLFSIIAMATKFRETTLDAHFREEKINSVVITGQHTRLEKIDLKWKYMSIISAAVLALGSLGFASFSQTQLLSECLDSTLGTQPFLVPLLIALFLTLLTFTVSRTTARKVTSWITQSLLLLLIICTATIWIKHHEISKSIIHLVLSDALSGKSAAAGALGTTILIGFSYAFLTLQSGFGPSSGVYASDPENSPRQSGANAILEPLIIGITLVAFTATIILFSGNYGPFRYNCNSPYSIGFERGTYETLPLGWSVTNKFPNDSSAQKHYNGKKVLEYNLYSKNPESVFLPRIPISTQTSIRFAFLKLDGEMSINVLKHNGEQIGELSLSPGKDSVTFGNKKRVWIEGSHVQNQWAYYVIRFGDLTPYKIINSEPVILQITPGKGQSHWMLDRFEPVESPTLLQSFLISVQFLFPHSGNILLSLLLTGITFVALFSWLQYGESGINYLSKNKRALIVYRILFLSTIALTPFIEYRLGIIPLLIGITILLIINTFSILLSIKKHKDGTHE